MRESPPAGAIRLLIVSYRCIVCITETAGTELGQYYYDPTIGLSRDIGSSGEHARHRVTTITGNHYIYNHASIIWIIPRSYMIITPNVIYGRIAQYSPLLNV